MSQHDLVFLYDFLHAKGGAERVLRCMYENIPGDVCVGFVNRESFVESFDPQHLIDLKAFHPFAPLKMFRVLRAFHDRAPKLVANYPCRIYSGAYAPLAHRQGHLGKSIYYCHTPPRFLYDLREHYQASFPAWQRPLLAALRHWLQPRYEAAVRSMDVVLANSRNVQARLQRYVGVESRVVYPPVETELFRWIDDRGYFLSTARLEPLKRVELLVKAFMRMPQQRLVVSSGGSDLPRLQALAAGASNIHFTGWLNDEELARLMGEARASIYIPVDEDFGMSPVESMAAGKPVIGVAEGGLLETVVHGETGELLPPGFGVEDIIAAVSALDANRARTMRNACEAQARRFSRTRFLKDIEGVLHCG